MTGLRQDVRFAARTLRRDPVFAAVAVLILALGFGATIGMFSVTNAVLFRVLPVYEPDRLVALERVSAQGDAVGAFSYPLYLDLRKDQRALAGLAAYALAPVTINVAGDSRRTVLTFVSDNYFRVLGVEPAVGRFLTRDDAEIGAAPVVVLGFAEWRQRFGGSQRVVGRTIRVNGVPATIIGVAPEGFNGTIGMFRMGAWASLPTYQRAVAGDSMVAGTRSWLTLFGRLKTGVGIEQARAVFASNLDPPNPTASSRERSAPALGLVPLRPAMGSTRTALTALSAFLLATALLVLGIASTNVAGLLLARALSREKEFAMRAALGASRNRMLRQSLVESVVLWGVGACLGLVVAVLSVERLPDIMPVQQTFPVHLSLDTTLDARVLTFALGISLLAGLVFGAIPALRASGIDLMLLLRDSAGAGKFRSWVHGAALATQVGASVLLLIVAALFVRSIRHAADADPGFDPDPVTWASLDLAVRPESNAEINRSLARLLEEIRENPLVAAVGLSSEVPLGGTESTTEVSTGGSVGVPVRISGASSGFFSALQIPLLIGRDFRGVGDGADVEVIVNRRAAESLWPGKTPLGQQLHVRNVTATVVGMTENVQSGRLGESPRPTVYVPYSRGLGEAHLLVRTVGSTKDGPRIIRGAVERAFPGAAAAGPSPLREVILSAMPQGMLANLVGGFSLVGLVLTSIGLFGAVTFFIVQSAREIGIRAALGATPFDLTRFILARGMAPAFTGLAIGIGCAFGVSRLLQSLFAGLSAWDPVAFVLGPLVLLTIGGAASVIPAIWVVRRNPAQALKAM